MAAEQGVNGLDAASREGAARRCAEPSPGVSRAAALLLALGPEAAAAVFAKLDESELRLIASGAKWLRRQGPQIVSSAVDVYLDEMDGLAGETAAGHEALRDAATRAHGEELARRVFDDEVTGDVLSQVAQADPDSLAMVLSHEHPQTIALILSSLDAARVGAVLERMPDRMRPDVLRRMATIDAVAPEVLHEIAAALSSELRALFAGGMRKVNGKAIALEVLRRCPVAQQGEVIAEIEKDSAALAAELRGRLFTFDDLKKLADRDLQTLLREIDTSKLSVALKGASGDVRAKFLSNLSQRAAEMLEDDLAAMGPVKLSTVETAQMEIAKLAQDASREGRITIVGSNETML
jgi:flagellar motor switch protein FliG